MMKKQKLPMKREFSAGGVVYKKEGQDFLWLLGKHSGYHKWVLPKGKIEEGEKGRETAVREVEEEVGVKARVIEQKPIHKDQYWFMAELKKEQVSESGPVRRVLKYQENEDFGQATKKVKVFKSVSFYLMEYESGDPEDHDWEMEEAGWYSLGEALEKMAFEGEKEALRRAAELVT